MDNIFGISSSRTGAETITRQKQKFRLITNATASEDRTIKLDSDEALYVVPTVADITLTLPDADTFPNDGYLYNFWVKNGSDDYSVTLQLSNNNTFSAGHTKLELPNKSSFMQLGGAYIGDGVQGWINATRQVINIQTRLSSSWSGANFRSFTAAPFDSLDVESNSEIIGNGIGKIVSISGNGTTATCTTDGKHPWTTGASVTISDCSISGYNGTHTITVTGTDTFTFSSSETSGASDGDLDATKVYCRVTGTYQLSYWASVAAGTADYVVEAKVRKNGTTDIAGTLMSTGNYQGENQSLGIGKISVDLDAGDYLELMFDCNTTANDPSVSSVTLTATVNV